MIKKIITIGCTASLVALLAMVSTQKVEANELSQQVALKGEDVSLDALTVTYNWRFSKTPVFDFTTTKESDRYEIMYYWQIGIHGDPAPGDILDLTIQRPAGVPQKNLAFYVNGKLSANGNVSFNYSNPNDPDYYIDKSFVVKVVNTETQESREFTIFIGDKGQIMEESEDLRIKGVLANATPNNAARPVNPKNSADYEFKVEDSIWFSVDPSLYVTYYKLSGDKDYSRYVSPIPVTKETEITFFVKHIASGRAGTPFTMIVVPKKVSPVKQIELLTPKEVGYIGWSSKDLAGLFDESASLTIDNQSKEIVPKNSATHKIGSNAKLFNGRFLYIDLGEDYQNYHLRGTYTQYRPWSSGEYNVVKSVSWANEVTKDGAKLTKDNLVKFNSKKVISANQYQWTQDSEFGTNGHPVLGRYLILEIDGYTDRVSEFAIGVQPK